MAKKKMEVDEERTAEELYEQAQELDIEGRSSMNKEELAEAVAEAESSEEAEPTPESEKQGGDETLPGESLDVESESSEGERGSMQRPSPLTASVSQRQGPKKQG